MLQMEKILLVLILTFGSCPAVAQLNTGNGLLRLGEASERNADGRGLQHDPFNSGTFNGFVAGAAWILDDLDPKVCLPLAATIGQLNAVVLRYLRQNPEQLHRGSWLLVREALQQAFPCR